MAAHEWIFYVRCATNEEADTEPDEGFKYPGLIFGTRDDALNDELPCYKITFIGSLEAAVGFVVCFFYKYAKFYLYEEKINLNCGYPEIDCEIEKNFIYNQYADKCLFKICPDKTAVVHYAEDTDEYYYCTSRIEDHLTGHEAMLSLHIDDAQIYEDSYCDGGYIARVCLKEKNGHEEVCKACADPDSWCDFSGEWVECSDFEKFWRTECKVTCIKI
jgi:hypothetical protein